MMIPLLKAAGDVSAYRSQPVDQKTLDSVLEALSYTISAANTRPWELYLIESPEARQELDRCVLDSMLRDKETDSIVLGSPVVAVMAIDTKRAKSRFGEIGSELYAVQDTAIAVNNIRLVATEMGLRLTWVREVDLEKVAEVLSLPRIVRPVALFTMGYSDQVGDSPPPVPVKYYLHVV